MITVVVKSVTVTDLVEVVTAIDKTDDVAANKANKVFDNI